MESGTVPSLVAVVPLDPFAVLSPFGLLSDGSGRLANIAAYAATGSVLSASLTGSVVLLGSVASPFGLLAAVCRTA